jgi:hypothetical protein
MSILRQAWVGEVDEHHDPWRPPGRRLRGTSTTAPAAAREVAEVLREEDLRRL